MLCLVSEKYQGKKNKMLRKIIFFILWFYYERNLYILKLFNFYM